MSIVVYYKIGAVAPFSETFLDSELAIALARVEVLRKDGARHVCISSEMEASIGKPGVTSVEDGKTPDGEVYDWSKQHRAGTMRKR